MNVEMAIDLLRSLITISLVLIGPIVLVAVGVGVAVSLFQAVTSIQEQTLTFVPEAGRRRDAAHLFRAVDGAADDAVHDLLFCPSARDGEVAHPRRPDSSVEALFDPVTIYALMLIFSRAGGLLALAPAFSGQSVPLVIRVALAFLLARMFVSARADCRRKCRVTSSCSSWRSPMRVAVGLLMGMAVRLIFYALEMAGQIMATEIGLMMSTSLDPVSRAETSPVTTALSYLGIVIFFASGAHHLMLLAFRAELRVGAGGGRQF